MAPAGPIAPIERVGVVGAGAWGTALALVAARAGRQVTLWARRPALAAALQGDRENAAYLPGIAVPVSVSVTADPAALASADALLLAMPAQTLRESLSGLASSIAPACPLVICAKGIERDSGKLLSEILAEAAPGRPAAILSGPSFAAEVARDLPTALTLACDDEALGRALVGALGHPHFRPYLSHDPVGVQLGGAVKNVIAIACGLVAGRRLGHNARAALITRGLAEIARLGRALGAEPATFMGLSGLGDLVLTCSATQSRNYAFGLALGEGQSPEQALAASAGVVEGRSSAAAVQTLARAKSLEMPISEAVDSIVNRGSAIDSTIAALLARPFRSETG